MAGEYYTIYCQLSSTRGAEIIKKLAGRDCLVQTTDKNIFLPCVRLEQDGLYNLAWINSDTNCKSVLFEQALVKAAPIIWYHRRDLA